VTASAHLLDSEARAVADVAARRARLVLVPSVKELVRDGLPPHLEKIVRSLFSDLRRRSFLPVVRARSLSEGVQAATHGMAAFCEVWPAIQVTLLPWFLENPTRLAPTAQLSRDFWGSPQARRRLGDLACAEFAAAQDARLLLAEVLLQLTQTTPDVAAEVGNAIAKDPLRWQAVLPSVLGADYALLLGMFTVTEPRKPRPAAGLIDWLARSSRVSARDAYSQIATDLFQADAKSRRGPE
jgi:hypothetical protein